MSAPKIIYVIPETLLPDCETFIGHKRLSDFSDLKDQEVHEYRYAGSSRVTIGGPGREGKAEEKAG